MSYRAKDITARQGVVVIYISLLLSLVLGLISSSLTAKLMSESELGRYRFLLSAISVVSAAFTFGMLSSAGTLLARKQSARSRKMVVRGAFTQCWIISLACILCALVVIYFDIPKQSVFFASAAALTAGAMAWPLLLQESLRAEGNYVGLATLNVLPPALFIVFIGILTRTAAIHLDSAICATLFFLSQSFVALLLLLRRGRLEWPSMFALNYLCRRNKSLGLKIYWASFLGALTAQAGIFALQSTGISSDVAIFSLAVTISAPLTMLPSAVGTAYFRHLPGASGFPKNVIKYAWIASALVSICFVLIVPIAIQLLYGIRYSDVKLSAQICGVAAMIHGMGDVYNRYYLANRQSALLLKVAAAVCTAALILSFSVGTIFGPAGSAIARLLSSSTYVLLLGFQYHTVKNRFDSTRRA